MGGNEGKVSGGESEVGLGEREERIEEMRRKRDRGGARLRNGRKRTREG